MYSILPTPLHQIADSAAIIIGTRYSLPTCKIEEPIHPDISWTPTLHWKTKTGYIACEVSETPYPTILVKTFTEIIHSNLPIRIISAFPIDHSLSPKDFEADRNKAKRSGIGLLPAGTNNDGSIDYHGISIPLFMPPIDLKKYKSILHPNIRSIFDTYMGGNPKAGVQELGQLVESIIYNLANQAKKNNKLGASSYINGAYYPCNRLIEDMIAEASGAIINKQLLKKCGTFMDDRNIVSHPPKTIKSAIQIESRLKNLFTNGLYILEEIPNELVKAHYRLRL